jgi:hypothetical protein
MPYCHNCGKPVNETDRFCASCFVELFLRDSPHNGVRRFPTPLPEQTRTRLLTPDSGHTDQTRDYGKTRLIDYDKEESEPTPVSGKTRLIDYDKEESEPNQASGKTRLIDYDKEKSEPTPVSGKTRLIDDSNIEGLVAEDIPPSKSFPQQTESFKTRLISDYERPGTSKAAGKEVSFAKIDLVEFEIARANARKYKKARNTWLIIAIIFFCASGAFVPLYVVADDELRDYRWLYQDAENELNTIREDYETKLDEYENLERDYKNLKSDYDKLKEWKDDFDEKYGGPFICNRTKYEFYAQTEALLKLFGEVVAYSPYYR